MDYPLIELPTSYIEEFRECINKNSHLILNNEPYHERWNILCACMDRIEDIAKYLNSKKLGEKHNYGCAFDLIEFLLHSASMLNCIDTIIETLEAEKEIDIPEIIFTKKLVTNQEGLKEKLTKIRKKKPYKNEDDLYFEYIRSIGVVHPNSTDRHQYFQQYERETSPFLIWNHLIGLSDGDISLHIYDSGGKSGIRSLKLQLSEIYAYVTSRYNRMLTLKKVLNSRLDNLATKLKSQTLLSEKDYGTYDEYLLYLKDEAHKRSRYLGYCIEQTAKMLGLNGIPKEVASKYSKYCNALQYAIKNFRELLQSPILEKSFNDEILIEELHLADILPKDETSTTGYYYEKAARLYDEDECNQYDITWFRIQAKELYKIVKKYAPVDKKTLDKLGNLQLLAVLNTALYFYNLDHDTFINKKIPASNAYR